MRSATAIILPVLALAALLGGCGHKGAWGIDPPAMGQAHRQQVASQTLDPEAGGDAPVLGLHGPTAERVMDAWVTGDDGRDETDAMATQMAPQ